MNNELLNLYTSKWKGIQSAFVEINADASKEFKPSNPQLVFITNEEDLRKADLRIMFFGQEANDWYEDQENDYSGIDRLLKCYAEYITNDKIEGTLWRGIRKFLKLIHETYPDKNIKYIYNNVIKIGETGAKNRPKDYITEIEWKYFSVVLDELKIIKPNVCIFFSGPNYDDVIKRTFGDIKYEAIAPFTERQLARIAIPNIDFAFRTYHPSFLLKSGSNIEPYLNSIIEQIKI